MHVVSVIYSKKSTFSDKFQSNFTEMSPGKISKYNFHPILKILKFLRQWFLIKEGFLTRIPLMSMRISYHAVRHKKPVCPLSFIPGTFYNLLRALICFGFRSFPLNSSMELYPFCCINVPSSFIIRLKQSPPSRLCVVAT